MMTGLATSCVTGTAEDCLLIFDRFDFADGTGCRVRLKAIPTYGDDYWGVVCRGKIVAVVYLPEGELREVVVIYDYEVTQNGNPAVEHPISIVPNGGWSDASFVDLAVQQQAYMLDKATTLQLDFDCIVEVLNAFGDLGQLSGWTLQGLRRGLNGRPSNSQQHIRLDVIIENNAGTYTVLLQMNTLVVASGSRFGNGAIVLDEQNGSGLSVGGVTIAFSVELALGDAFLEARWAQKYELHIGASPLTFPHAADGIVLDAGLSNRLSGKVTKAAGTYDYLVRAITDTLITGNNTAAAGTILIPGRPQPISALALQSSAGDSTGTKIQWQASATNLATYRIYDSALDSPTDFNAAPSTHIAGSGTITFTMPSLGAGVTGKRRIVVVAVNGGIEDGYRLSLAVEYDAGAIVRPRPNIATFGLLRKNGRTLTVQYSYNHVDEAGVGASVQLFLVRKGAALNLASPDATGALPSGAGIVSGSISALAGADDWYQYLIVIGTSGGVDSPNVSLQGPEWLSSAVPAAVGNVSATLVA